MIDKMIQSHNHIHYAPMQYTVIITSVKFDNIQTFFLFLLKQRSWELALNCGGSNEYPQSWSNIYYSKFDKGQNFNFVCRRCCVSDTKKFMIDM